MRPLIEATKLGNVEKVRKLLGEAGTDAGAADKNGATPLHWAALKGHSVIAGRLLGAGADANAANKYGSTPLHWAANNGHEAIVRHLLWAGADVSAPNKYGDTPIHQATRNEHAVIVRLLENWDRDNGANAPRRREAIEATRNKRRNTWGR